MKTTRALVLAIAAIVLAAELAVTIGNYRECRRAGFSRIYCATTHLFR